MPPKLGRSYPGGPSQSPDSRSKGRLLSADELEGRGRDRMLRNRRRKRLRAALIVGIVTTLAAGWFGFSLGVESRVDAAQPDGAAESSPEQFMNEQLNRLMLELWRMEDLEDLRR